MSQVMFDLQASTESLTAAMKAMSQGADASASQMDQLGAAVKQLEASVEKLANSQTSANEAAKKTAKISEEVKEAVLAEKAAQKARAQEWKEAAATVAQAERDSRAAESAAQKERLAEWKVAEKAHAKGQESQRRATEQAEKLAAAEKAKAEAIAKAAESAEMSATIFKAQGRTFDTLIDIGGQYAEMLRSGAVNNVELMRTWQQALSPAEKTALNMVKLAAATDEATRESVAWALATDEANQKLEDQIRRQDTNVGSQNKLSRSLSELIDELKDSQTKTSLAAAAQQKHGETAEDLVMVLRQLAFETSEVDKASDQYKETVKAVQKRIEGLRLDEEKQTKTQKDAADSYEKTTKKLDALETAMESLSIPGAGLIGRFKQLSDSLETIHSNGSKTQANLLKAGIAFGTVGAAAGAAVVGVAAIGAAIIGVASQASEWNEDLKDLGLQLDAVGTARVDRVSASLATVGSSFKAAGVAMTDALAPALEMGGKRFTALGLAAVDGFKNLQQGEGVINRLIRLSAEGLTEALFAPVTAIAKLGKAFAELGRMAGFDSMAAGAEEFDNIVKGWKGEQVDAVTAALKLLANDAVKPLIAVTDDYMARADKLVTKQVSITKAAKTTKEAEKEQIIAMRQTATVLGSEVVPAFEAYSQVLSGPTSEAVSASIDEFSALAVAAEDTSVSMVEAASSFSSSILDAVNGLSELSTGLDIVSLFREQGPQTGAAIVEGLVATLENAPNLIGNITGAFASGLRALIENEDVLVDLAVGLVEAIVDAIPVLAPLVAELGARLVLGMISALPGMWFEMGKGLIVWVDSLADLLEQGIENAVIQPFKNFLAGILDAIGFDDEADALRGGSGQSVAQAEIARAQQQAVPVSDAYFPATSGPRTIQMATGDEATVTRAGALGGSSREDKGAHQRLDLVVQQLEALAGAVEGLGRSMLYQRHFGQAAGPALRR